MIRRDGGSGAEKVSLEGTKPQPLHVPDADQFARVITGVREIRTMLIPYET